MFFYLFLSVVSLLYLGVALVVARKHPIKREFAAAFFFTLVTFFVAVDPTQKGRLMFMITVLTIYNTYIIMKTP